MSSQIDTDGKSRAGNAEREYDRFLIEEGLDLLAAYRSIKDQKRRDRLKRLVIRCADVDKVDRDADEGVVVPFR